jgi:hypothetical protein
MSGISRSIVKWCGCAIAITCLYGTWAEAHFESSIDLVGMTTAADFIFEGRVFEVRYRNSQSVPLLDPTTGAPLRDEHGNILYADGSNLPHTFVTYKIDKIYKGFPPHDTSGDKVTLRFEGGQSDNVPVGRLGPTGEPVVGRYLMTEMVPLFDVGDRDILFVQGNTRSACPLADCPWGRLRILTDPEDTAPNGVFLELGQQVRYVIPPRSKPSEWQVFMGPMRPLSAILRHTLGDVEIRAVLTTPLEDGEEPAKTVPPGTQFDESQLDTHLSALVQELFTPDELKALPPVISADISTAFVSPGLMPTAPPRDPEPVGEPERPWLAELTEKERSDILEQEWREKELFRQTGGNPVLPQTPCELWLLEHGPIPGDISGPLERPDCRVDIQDLALMASNWLRCNDPAQPGCL